SQVPEITAAEREVLIRCARVFDRSPKEESATGEKARGDGNRPGSDFNLRGWDWDKILTGWTQVGKAGWRRPDKGGGGLSATTCCKAKQGGHELLHVFSTNAKPFEQGGNYSKFFAYALLHHGGDFGAAAKELARLGFGEQKKKGKKAEGSTKTASGKATPEPW